MAVGPHDVTTGSEAPDGLLPGGGADRRAMVRAPILASWRRCRTLGVAEGTPPDDPHRAVPDGDADSLVRAARPVLDSLEERLSGVRVTAFLSDERARLLERRVGMPFLNRRLDALRLAPGFSAAEQAIGTNGIGTAALTRQPAFVRGREHLADCLSGLSCVGVPIRDPLTGRVLGVLDLSCELADANDPHMIGVAMQAVRAIGQRLLDGTTARERSLLETYWKTRRRAAARGPGGTRAPLAELLAPRDLRLLEERATAMISSGRAGPAEVALTDGRTAVLLGRPVEDADGIAGIAVEALLPSGDLRRLDTPVPGAGHPGPGGPPPLPAMAAGPSGPTAPLRAAAGRHPAPPAPAPAPGTQDAGRWLLAIGEPGVGRLALRARQRLDLLFDAGACVGTTLDVTRTAEELAGVVVPQLADFAAVDLPAAVLLGEEPVPVDGPLRRTAAHGIPGFPGTSDMYQVGDLITLAPGTPQARALESGRPVREAVLGEAAGWIAQDPPRTGKILDAGVHSLIAVPLLARGTTLGVVSFYRSERPEPFEEDDLALAAELVSRVAVSIDNARRFTREHAVALALQRSLLPRGLPAQQAVEAAHRYLPARSGVGGDWFDVIPLSGSRVALVAGDVVGHGLPAAATMGRLRTAVQNMSALDLAVDEILTQLDDLVCRLDLDREEGEHGGEEIVGASCLYAVYDPVTQRCTLGRAGHPPPALVLPDGTVEFPELPPGPPLGLGGQPFETAEIEVPEGSSLVLYTDGLLQHLGRRDPDLGLERLRRALGRPGRTPEQTCRDLDDLLPGHPADDIALLVARARALDARHVAAWDLPADPAVVPRVRADVTAVLADWGLEELQFPTELAVSELVTNAIRHGSEPITLRLLRDSKLICEVSDGSSTAPHLRRARITDEGGRGLFLVAQLTQRWGTRYTGSGKVIWTEQPLPG